MALRVEASIGTSFAQDGTGNDGDLRFVRLARERWAAGSRSPGRCPPWWTLGFVVGGSLRLHRLQRNLGPGTLFCSAPGDHRLMEAHGRALEVMLRAFLAEEVGLLPARLRRESWLPVEDPATITRRFQDLVEEARPGDALAHAACVHRLHLLLLAAERAGAADEDDEQRARAHYATARQLFTEGWDRIASVEAVAEHCGISHAWLCRLFKRYGGCTPRQFWTSQRIRAAADRLWRDDIDLATVAEQVGFADQFAFSKAFKRVMGAAPSTWLARVRREG